MRRLVMLVAALGFVASGCRTVPSGDAAKGTERRPEAAATVLWEDFTPGALQRAHAENRLILVSVYTRWCHWCHVMDAKTWADPRVIRLLRDRFITLRVDADARPDLASRYREWGWPATAVLTPDAEPVLRIKGFRAPEKLLPALSAIVDDLDAGRELALRDVPLERAAASDDLLAVRDLLRGQLDGLYDEKQGGWGGPQKYPLAAPLEHLLRRAALEGDVEALARARFTLEQQRGVLDPVWGGMFQYSTHGVWKRPHFEKLARLQGWALEEYADAYRATGYEPFLVVAKQVRSYLEEHLRDPSGAFFANQDADVGHPGEPGHVLGKDFYARDDAGRRSGAQPFIDTSIYAEHNGTIIAGLARLYAATLDDAVLRLARSALRQIARTHRREDGTYRHAAVDDGLVHLSDQAAMARALLALHQVTGEPELLEEARTLLTATLSHLEDAALGGLFAHTAIPGARGVFAERQKPMRDNADIARALLVVAELTKDEAPRAAAERTLRFFARPTFLAGELRLVGEYLLAVEELVSPRLHLAVVSSERDDGALLWAEAVRVFAPGVVRERLAPGERFGDVGQAALYVCGETFCSPPILETSAVKERVARLLR